MPRITLVLTLCAAVAAVLLPFGKGSPGDNSRLIGEVHAQTPPKVVPISTREISELRVQTDRTIIDSSGDEVPYYELRKPGKDRVFLDFVLQVTAPYPMTLTRVDIKLAAIDGSGADHHPFDWFLDSGLAGQRAETLELGTGAQIGFTVEVPAAEVAGMGLFLWNRYVAAVEEMLPEGPVGPDRVHVVDATVTELTEYRMQTGPVRDTTEGRRKTYEKRTPRPGNVFLEIETQLMVENYRDLETRDFHLQGLVRDEELKFFPFDWFLHRGMEEARGEQLTLWNQGIITLLFEVPTAHAAFLELYVAETSAGSVGSMGN